MSRRAGQTQVLLGEKIKGLRQERGFSQERLAELAGLDRTYVSSLERGHRNISVENIARIANALETTLEELFEGV